MAYRVPIVKTRGICGGRARVNGTRIPVWSIEAYRQEGLSLTQVVSVYPRLDGSDVSHAFSYADANKEEIAADIEANRMIDDGELFDVR